MKIITNWYGLKLDVINTICSMCDRKYEPYLAAQAFMPLNCWLLGGKVFEEMAYQYMVGHVASKTWQQKNWARGF